uniref:Shiftless antiviral inhibitor of ribosomal frameshifting n=1 Tax=Leptobrachium leishanense TaxID=445787 RepID=A0A8C5P936_9ANUR
MQAQRQEELQLEKSVRRLREKFYGKISVETAVLLMRRFTNNHKLVCQFIILCKDELDAIGPDEINTLRNDVAAMTVINNINNSNAAPQDLARDQDIQNVARRLHGLALTVENVRMFNNASANRIPSEDRQFACGDCDRMWWRRVPQRKEVSKCRRCRQKYDPVPRDRMWGIAEFHCVSCSRVFKGHAQMGVSGPCYNCGTTVMPRLILPPRRNSGPRTRNPHSCYAEDCYNRREPHIPGLHCVHPRSRARLNLSRVLHASELHISTGSTVATCLSQGSLTQCDIDDIIMASIKEESEEESDDSQSRAFQSS